MSRLLILLLSTTLNVFFNPIGDGSLLRQVDEILYPPTTTTTRQFTFFSFVIISTVFLVSGLVSASHESPFSCFSMANKEPYFLLIGKLCIGPRSSNTLDS